MKIILVYFAYKYQGDWSKIYHALNIKEYVSFDEIMKIKQTIKQQQWNVLTILDEDYPHQLKSAYKPPFVLWYRGNKQLLNNKFICMISNNDDIVYQQIKQFLLKIKGIYAFISLKDVDFYQTIYHNFTPKAHLIILASGLNNHILLKNENTLVLSEYPPYVKENKHNFLACNRLIAAFSTLLIITSYTKNNDCQLMLNLINNFFNLGKEVIYFSNSAIDKDINNKLLQQNIKLITSIKDLPR